MAAEVKFVTGCGLTTDLLDDASKLVKDERRENLLRDSELNQEQPIAQQSK